jgi:hypothetical protein
MNQSKPAKRPGVPGRKLLILISDDWLAWKLVAVAKSLRIPVSRLARLLVEAGLRSVKRGDDFLFAASKRPIPAKLLEDVR